MTAKGKHNKTWGAGDFARYHDGRMPPAEMHQLERAALEDPILAEALEGYAQPGDHSNQLSDLKKDLNKRIRRDQQSTFIWRRMSPPLRVAALFLLLAGAGWFVFRMFDRSGSTLALKEREESVSSSANNPVTEDTTTSHLSTPIKDSPTPVAPVALSKPGQPVLKDESAASTAPPPGFTPLPDSTVAPEAGAPKKTTRQMAETPMGEPSAANVQVFRAEEPVTVEYAGEEVIFRFPSTDGKAPAAEEKSRAARSKKISAPSLTFSGPAPARGWEAYRTYLSGQNEWKKLVGSVQEGTQLRFHFEVNASGWIEKTRLEPTTCTDCASTLGRLLKNGPFWSAAGSRKGLLVIRK